MVAVGDDITASDMNKRPELVVVTDTITIALGSNSNTKTVAYGATFNATPTGVAQANTGTWNVGAQAYNFGLTSCTVRVFRTPGDNASAAEAVPITLIVAGDY